MLRLKFNSGKKEVRIFFLILFIYFAVVNKIASAQEISLWGEWRFRIDSNNVGINEKWYTKKLDGTIKLPGSMNTNKLGDDITLQTKWTASIYDSSFFFLPRLAKYRKPDNIKIPFWLSPLKHYVGAAWYQKEFIVPETWRGKSIQFFIERAHIATQIWVDNKPYGQIQNSLVGSHQYHIEPLIPGRHIITVRVDNDLKNAQVGQDSHSVSDHTQGNWNGMVGRISINVINPITIDDVQVYPDVENGRVKIAVLIINQSDRNSSTPVNIKIAGQDKNKVVEKSFVVESIAGDTTAWEQWVVMGKNISLWDEFNPYVYTAIISTKGVSTHTTFGMRKVSIIDRHIAINNHPVFLRGDLNNCEFPLTGHPPMEVKPWLQLMGKLKSMGINHIRFHSWCPPEAAFDAADQLGIYLQPEAPTWPNHGTSLGDGRFIDQYIYEETNRMQQQYGNHPSFIMLAAGNEPAGKNQAAYLAKFIQYWKAKDKRRVYTGASVAMSWPLVPENEYMIKSGARGLSWGAGLPSSMDDYGKAIASFNVPYVTHEQGQWCVFPDFSEISKYTGAYRARNFEMFQQDFIDQGLGGFERKFLMASGKLQALCYKMEIEKSLRTKDLAGFQLLGVQDFPGQGTALVGVLNPFYEEKGYIKAFEFKQFCNATVPLLRLPKFVWSNDERIEALIEVFHFGQADIKNIKVKWDVINDNGEVITNGSFSPNVIRTGQLNQIGGINVDLRKVIKPSMLTIKASIDTTAFSNQWNVWVYPKANSIADASSIYITDTLNDKAQSILNNKGSVLLNLYGKIKKGKEVIQAFTPVFWNTSWFKMRPPHTLGLWIDTTYSLFKNFPTSYHSDLQWYDIVTHAQAMHLEDFPSNFKVPVRNIDTWFMNRRLAMLFEARLGNGKLLVCSADLSSNLDQRPAAKQLLYSIKEYMMSIRFNPQQEVKLDWINGLINSKSQYVFDTYTKDSPDELKPLKSSTH